MSAGCTADSGTRAAADRIKGGKTSSWRAAPKPQNPKKWCNMWFWWPSIGIDRLIEHLQPLLQLGLTRGSKQQWLGPFRIPGHHYLKTEGQVLQNSDHLHPPDRIHLSGCLQQLVGLGHHKLVWGATGENHEAYIGENAEKFFPFSSKIFGEKWEKAASRRFSYLALKVTFHYRENGSVISLNCRLIFHLSFNNWLRRKSIKVGV